jgi:transcriptional regulator of acetoin/glycerol metabolism
MASWQRCLINGQRPDDDVVFNPIQRSLGKAAQPVMAKLLQAMADARYCAVVTPARGGILA